MQHVVNSDNLWWEKGGIFGIILACGSECIHCCRYIVGNQDP